MYLSYVVHHARCFGEDRSGRSWVSKTSCYRVWENISAHTRAVRLIREDRHQKNQKIPTKAAAIEFLRITSFAVFRRRGSRGDVHGGSRFGQQWNASGQLWSAWWGKSGRFQGRFQSRLPSWLQPRVRRKGYRPRLLPIAWPGMRTRRA